MAPTEDKKAHRARRCSAVSASGKPCGAFAGHGSRFCLSHDPARREQAQEVRRSGGRAGWMFRSRAAPPDGLPEDDLPEPPACASDMAAVVSVTIRNVLTGRLSPQRGKVVQDLARQWAKLNPAGTAPKAKAPEGRDDDTKKLTDEELYFELLREAEIVKNRLAVKGGSIASPRAGSNGTTGKLLSVEELRP